MTNDNDSTQLLDALRTAFIEEGLATKSGWDTAPSDPLLRFTEHRAFKLGALVPIGVTATRSISSLVGTRRTLPQDDSALVAEWQPHLDATIQRFAEDPDEWSDPGVEKYLRQCAVVFGVEDSLATRLLRRFHQMTEAERFGIFVTLLRSPSFTYIKREIDAMPEDVDVEIDDPKESLKALIRSAALV